MEDCDRDHLARGLCRKHYEAQRRTGDPLGGLRGKRAICSEADCFEQTVGNGMCRRHYGKEYMRRVRAAKKAALPPRSCKFCGNPIPITRSQKAVFCTKACKISYEAGLASAEYQRMLVAQGGRCAICRRTKPNGKHDRWCIDHDHKTGRKRGLLCINCNSALGFVNDDPEILQAAIRYLSR